MTQQEPAKSKKQLRKEAAAKKAAQRAADTKRRAELTRQRQIMYNLIQVCVCAYISPSV